MESAASKEQGACTEEEIETSLSDSEVLPAKSLRLAERKAAASVSNTPISESCCSTELDVPVIKKTIQMRLRLPSLAMACDRTGVSFRSATVIANAVLQDVGLISPENVSKVIDKNKIGREINVNRQKVKQETFERIGSLQGLYFDGRKDSTLVNVQENGKYYRKTILQEHITLISEPGTIYLGHVSPDTSTAVNTSRTILNFIQSSDISMENLCAIGCDGTAVNTGPKGGIIKLLEDSLEKPLQWLVCQLHANELPLRHLLQHIDGHTTGPRCFSGPIGKLLAECENMPVVKYQIIQGQMPSCMNPSDLSTDQCYLLDICNPVISGHCPEDLSLKNPGKLAHSRWLTAANRILRLYISTENPNGNLRILTEYVIKVYAPTWFKIKASPLCKDGSRHLYALIKNSRYLSEDLRKIVDPVIQRNAFFAHPENMLLAMITDDRKHIRELGLQRIINARKNKSDKPRLFKIPQLCFECDDCIDIIEWPLVVTTEPPIVGMVGDEELCDMVNKGSVDALQFPRFPCRTQGVERTVKIVTEASAAVCDSVTRDGFIRARIASRKKMPKFDCKQDYKP